MKDLEQRVRQLTMPAVARDPEMLEAAAEGRSVEGSQDEVNRIVMGALDGVHQALVEIARGIDSRK